MATQEERITVLEQTFATFRKENAEAIVELQKNNTILLGVLYSHGQDIKKIFQLIDVMDHRLDTVDHRLDTVDHRLDTVDHRLDSIDQHLGTMDQRLGTMDQRLGTMDQRLGTMDQRLGTMETKFDEHTILLTQILARLPNT